MYLFLFFVNICFALELKPSSYSLICPLILLLYTAAISANFFNLLFCNLVLFSSCCDFSIWPWVRSLWLNLFKETYLLAKFAVKMKCYTQQEISEFIVSTYTKRSFTGRFVVLWVFVIKFRLSMSTKTSCQLKFNGEPPVTVSKKLIKKSNRPTHWAKCWTREGSTANINFLQHQWRQGKGIWFRGIHLSVILLVPILH